MTEINSIQNTSPGPSHKTTDKTIDKTIGWTIDKNPTTISASFAKAIMDPDIPVPDYVVAASGRKDLKRFTVYRNNVVTSLIEALSDAYPSIKAILGEKNFALVARNYVFHHPPKSPMMQDFGSNFAEFSENFRPLDDLPFLGDVARCERAWLEAFHAPDELLFTTKELSIIEPEKLDHISLQPRCSSFLICSKWPVGDLFGYRDEIPAKGPNLEDNQNLLITRPSFYVEARMIDSPTALFFDCLLNGKTLSQSAMNVFADHNDANIASLIALACNSGAFSKAVLKSPATS